MALKKLKPTSPGTRFQVRPDKSFLHKGKPVRALVAPLKSTGGRNTSGRLTTRHKGGGHKQKHRIVDFRRDKDGVPGRVERLEHDPGRSAYLALVLYRRRRAPLHPGAQGRRCRRRGAVGHGGADPPRRRHGAAQHAAGLGRARHRMKPGKAHQLARSAGTSAQYTGREGGYAILRLKSGEMRRVNGECRATLGSVGNEHKHDLRSFGRAGAKRWLGIRPTVRGVVMNPVDHPHGGGEGRSGRATRIGSRRGAGTPRARTRKNKRSRTHSSCVRSQVERADHGTFAAQGSVRRPAPRKKVQEARDKNDRRPDQSASRRSMVLPDMVGLTISRAQRPPGTHRSW